MNWVIGGAIGWLVGSFLYGFLGAAYKHFKVRRLIAPSR